MTYLWYKDAVFYQVYVRAFRDGNGDGHGDFAGLTSSLDYFSELGVNCLWIMPIYPSPLKDDGYDVADYYGIHPDYGTLADFQVFLNEAHKRELRVIVDLVLNHTSDQHPWFQAARTDPKSPYRDYYVWSETDQRFVDARIIFLDIEESNWAYDRVAEQYYWHRFFSSQPDLNYDNPEVQQEMLNIIQYWLEMGVDGFRVDAVPYLYEREGTICENLPETHAFLKKIRTFVNEHFPDRLLLCEANQWPDDVRVYFGDGDECHMGFHFPIMPRVFMALKKGDVTDMVNILNRTPDIPDSCQWATFLRNHDELTLEMVTPEQREWMWEQYAPEPRMRLNLGIRRRLAPLLDNDRRKIEVANSLLFTLPGSPIIYYGDELGMGDNIWLKDRDGVRTPMQWRAAENGGFSDVEPEFLYSPVIDDEVYGLQNVNVEKQCADPNSLFHVIQRMIAVRKTCKPLGWGHLDWMECDSSGVAAFIRQYEGERILSLNNVRDEVQEFTIKLPNHMTVPFLTPIPYLGNAKGLDLLDGILHVRLEPYQYIWVKV